MGRYQVKPIIFCINNQGFMVERALEEDPNPSYDDLAQLNYAQLPAAFGCEDWLVLKITTEEELAHALTAARKHPHGVYLELVTGKYDYGTALDFYNKHIKALYS
jgi:indolepyruvate decarboxylase